MSQPLVSIIVTTLNNHATLDACLASITKQTYGNFELIVVDNFSADDTVEIAKRYTPQVYVHGPERCAQRNFAVRKATGEFVVIIDSDMELSPKVVAACVAAMQTDPALSGVIIPEESFGDGFWAQCKRLERSFYVGIDWIEAARFFRKDTFEAVGGYDESLVSGEDWDLSQRAAAVGKLGRIGEFIYHNEGHIKLFKTLKKKTAYAQKFTSYTEKKPAAPTAASRNPYLVVLKRFGLYFSHPVKLFKKPHYGAGVLVMKIGEFGFGAIGYLFQKQEREQ